MQRLPLVLPLVFLPALGACPTEGGNSIFEQDPWRDDWQTVVDGAVLPGECPDGALGCECATGMACDAGSCNATADSDYCVDPGAKAGTKGGACDKMTCEPGLLCSPLDLSPDDSVCVDPPGDEVASLTIGGTEVSENFINRGDVEVYFNGPEGKITVELRRFTFAPDAATAQDNWDRMIPWNYSGTVVAPSDEIMDEDCTDAFRNGCQIRVWYDGQTQPVRDGADIRVTLPPSYVGHLDIVTEDNVVEDEYPDHGDVTINNLRGSAEIELDSGNVMVKLADDILEGPTCGPEAVAACENYTDPDSMEPKPWDTSCGCTDFGQVKVSTRPERAANITVDIPGDLWGTTNMENAQPGMKKSDETLCTASVDDCKGIDACEDLIYDANFPWKRQTEFNDPGDFAPAGAGFGFPLKSEGCQIVNYVNGPDDWGKELKDEKRGDLLVCNGCLDIANP